MKYTECTNEELIQKFAELLSSESEAATLCALITTHGPGGDQVFARLMEGFRLTAVRKGASADQIKNKEDLCEEVRRRSLNPDFKKMADESFREACVAQVGRELFANRSSNDNGCSIL